MVPWPWQGERHVSTTQNRYAHPTANMPKTRRLWRIEGIDKSASLHDLGTGTTSCFLTSHHLPLALPSLFAFHLLFLESTARGKKPGVLLAIYLGRDLFTARDSVEVKKIHNSREEMNISYFFFFKKLYLLIHAH